MTNRTDINISGARSLGQRTLNERIAAENKLIAEMVGLLKGGVQFQKWPDAAKAALTRALSYQGPNSFERSKAEHLRRHLFLDVPPPYADIALSSERSAERVRADLADLVPFGSGLSVLSDQEASSL